MCMFAQGGCLERECVGKRMSERHAQRSDAGSSDISSRKCPCVAISARECFEDTSLELVHFERVPAKTYRNPTVFRCPRHGSNPWSKQHIRPDKREQCMFASRSRCLICHTSGTIALSALIAGERDGARVFVSSWTNVSSWFLL